MKVSIDVVDCVCIDKWLWVVCFFKIWLQVIDVVECGCVQINDQLVCFVKDVKIGDYVWVYVYEQQWEIEVLVLVEVCGLVFVV